LWSIFVIKFLSQISNGLIKWTILAKPKIICQISAIFKGERPIRPKNNDKKINFGKMDLMNNGIPGRREEEGEGGQKITDDNGNSSSKCPSETGTEEEALDYMVAIPETDGQSAFSFRKLWAL
jgi:hypothetical protein